ncbi:MAG: hypothetical protein ACK5ME_12115 [Parahaliea sp.]
MFTLQRCLIVWAALSAPVLAEEPCESHFTKEGGFFKGTTFKTWADIKGISSSQAYKKAYLHLSKEGWKIVSSDKDIGIISASQDVSFGEGKTAPLNVVVEESGSGTKISISFSLSGGVMSPSSAVKDSFCDIITAAGQ